MICVDVLAPNQSVIRMRLREISKLRCSAFDFVLKLSKLQSAVLESNFLGKMVCTKRRKGQFSFCFSSNVV